MKSKRKVLILVFAAAILGGSACIMLPSVEDHFRDMRYKGYLEAARQHSLSRNDLFDKEDSSDWLNVSGQFGLNKLSDYVCGENNEAYRFTVLRMGRSGMITVVLGPHPTWEAVVDAKSARMSGKLSRSQVSKLRTMIERCRFWEISEYPESGGADGEEWFVEGILRGRYRRIHEWCPDRTYVEALGNTLASITVPELAEHTR